MIAPPLRSQCGYRRISSIISVTMVLSLFYARFMKLTSHFAPLEASPNEHCTYDVWSKGGQAAPFPYSISL